MLVNLKDILSEASQKGFAVGAFNCASLESARSAVIASEELGIPFVMQYAPVHAPYIPFDIAATVMLHLAKTAKTPICVHLDHGPSVDYCLKAMAAGFTSVMLDRSGAPYEQNLAESKLVAQVAHQMGVTVEAELGSMPHNFNDEIGEYRPEDFYTNPNEAARFVEETQVDALAISFGTVHGVYKTKPKLSIEVIDKVRDATGGLPLVMHGGSGLSADDYRNAIRAGIRKINYYTYEALAGGKGVYELVQEKPQGLQFHDVVVRATEAMAEDVKRVMKLFALQ